MIISRLPLLKGTLWTLASFVFGQLFRLIGNIILTRLLAPELFGIIQIVYSLQTGMELISDVGIGQNIVYNKNANDPLFYNTAWSLQLIRGIVLWLVISIAAFPMAVFYKLPILSRVIPIAALSIVLNGFASTSKFLLQKRMQYSTLTFFEMVGGVVFAFAPVAIAYFSPTIWSLVFGTLSGAMVVMVASYFIAPDVRHHFVISKQYALEILSFGKWIFTSSVIYFLSTNFDRLYLAKTIPLEALGVYGIARAISDVLSGVVSQLGGRVIFPFVASHSNVPRSELRTQLQGTRMKFLLVAALGLSLFIVTADFAVKILYDQRYHAASWMLPVLATGAWFSILCNVSESALLGLGAPHYTAWANCTKFIFLLVGFAVGVPHYGVVGGVFVVALGDLFRYVPIGIGQVKERFSFVWQDLFATASIATLIAALEILRWEAGWGTSFDALPLRLLH